ncbi:Linocin-M18 [Saezia sanguinis]|uniref:Linocin-M18 n=1 Tax=Saezia sanguinis TaxID=1965230 RepID=A0A433SBG1_9BURK|nr:family 1 encapsulin nanocompartment shell protein [Saezia sanguinis]RUS66088.1 Linocin-M18 [Saezia sanguinis]
MNNLHRELAPVSDEAWAQIEEEVVRTFKRNLGARRVVDINGPHGAKFTSVGTGHLKPLKTSDKEVITYQHEVLPLVKLRVPFTLNREDIDAVERGSDDSDWQPAKDAAEKLAYAEDRIVFEGFSNGGMEGMRAGTSNPVLTLPNDADDYPDVIAAALKQLRLAGVEGPYVIVMGAEAYTRLSEASDDGYPVISHIRRLVPADIVWAPAIQGAFILSMRGGDFELSLGRDLSIGYQSHSDESVKLYLEETLVFRLLTSEAVVAINSAAPRKK